MIIGGGVGRVLADAVAKTAATYMGKSLTQHQAAQLALKASATWKFRGTFLGAFGVNAELQTGEIYSDLLEIQGLEESQRAVLTALLGGVVGGFLETLVPFTVARMWGLGGPFLVGLAKRIAAQPALASQVVRAAGLVAQGVATVVAGAGVEGLTEVAQGEIGNLAKSLFDSHFSWTSSETVRDRKENFAKAFIVGGAIGGAGHAGQLVTASSETSTTAQQTTTASADPTVLQTARDKTGAFHVTPEARAAAAPQSGTTGGDALQKNDKGYYEVPSGSSKVTRPGSKVRSFDPGGSKLEFEDGMVMDTRYAWALVGNEPYVVIGVDTGSHIGWLRSPKAQQVVSRLLATITFVLPFAGGSHSSDASIASPKRWDPISRLPENLQKRLSAGDRTLLNKVTGELQHRVAEHELNYIPVFGYLSLRHDNYRELGIKDQSEVVSGTHVEKATLDNHAIDVVASTVFRGTPEHPGVVAGLSKKTGQNVPGVMLKIPLDRAEELLAVLYAREFFAESDLRDRSDKDGNAVSNAMYAPAIETITVGDGKNTREVPALVFRTNPDGAKFLGDLTTEQLAHLMAAQGGFVDADGKTRGGATLEYWLKGYINARTAANEPIDPRIAAAVELAPLFPTLEVLRQLSTRNDPAALRMLEALRVMFQGAASPLALRQEQAPGPAVTRPPRQEAPADLEERLHKRALELKELHPGDFDLALEAGAGKALTQLKSQAGVRTNMDTPGRLTLHPAQDANGFTPRDTIGHINYYVTKKNQLVIITSYVTSDFTSDAERLRKVMLTELTQKYPTAELTDRNRASAEPAPSQNQPPASPPAPQYQSPASRPDVREHRHGEDAEADFDMSSKDSLAKWRSTRTEAKQLQVVSEAIAATATHQRPAVARRNGLSLDQLWDLQQELQWMLEPVHTSSVFTKGQREEITAALAGKTGQDFDTALAAIKKQRPDLSRLTREMVEAWNDRTFTTLEKRIMCAEVVRTNVAEVAEKYGISPRTLNQWFDELDLPDRPRRYNQRTEAQELEILRYYSNHTAAQTEKKFNTYPADIWRLRVKHNVPSKDEHLDPKEREARTARALYWIDTGMPMVRAAELADVSYDAVKAAHAKRGIPTARQQFWDTMKTEALALHDEGLTNREVADKLALEMQTIRYWIDSRQLPQLTPEQRAAAVEQGLELVSEGIPVSKAAWLLGVPRWVLRNAALKQADSERAPRQTQAVQKLETAMAKAFFLIDGGVTPADTAILLGLEKWQVQYWHEKVGRGVAVRNVEIDQIAAALECIRQGWPAMKAANDVGLDYQILQRALEDIPDWKVGREEKEAKEKEAALELTRQGYGYEAVARMLNLPVKRVTKWTREEHERVAAERQPDPVEKEALRLFAEGMIPFQVAKKLGLDVRKVLHWYDRSFVKPMTEEEYEAAIVEGIRLRDAGVPNADAARTVGVLSPTLSHRYRRHKAEEAGLTAKPKIKTPEQQRWDEQKAEALRLHEDGLSVGDIAKRLDVKYGTVHKWINGSKGTTKAKDEGSRKVPGMARPPGEIPFDVYATNPGSLDSQSLSLAKVKERLTTTMGVEVMSGDDEEFVHYYPDNNVIQTSQNHVSSGTLHEIIHAYMKNRKILDGHDSIFLGLMVASDYQQELSIWDQAASHRPLKNAEKLKGLRALNLVLGTKGNMAPWAYGRLQQFDEIVTFTRQSRQLAGQIASASRNGSLDVDRAWGLATFLLEVAANGFLISEQTRTRMIRADSQLKKDIYEIASESHRGMEMVNGIAREVQYNVVHVRQISMSAVDPITKTSRDAIVLIDIPLPNSTQESALVDYQQRLKDLIIASQKVSEMFQDLIVAADSVAVALHSMGRGLQVENLAKKINTLVGCANQLASFTRANNNIPLANPVARSPVSGER